MQCDLDHGSVVSCGRWQHRNLSGWNKVFGDDPDLDNVLAGGACKVKGRFLFRNIAGTFSEPFNGTVKSITVNCVTLTPFIIRQTALPAFCYDLHPFVERTPAFGQKNPLSASKM